MPSSKKLYLKRSTTPKWLLAFACLLAVILIVRFTAEFALKQFAQDLFSETLKTEVEIGSVSIGILEGRVTLANNRIRNLKGFSQPYIFKAKAIRIEGSFWDLAFRSQLNIRMIEIDHVQTWIQKNTDGYNYQILLQNLEPPSPSEPNRQEKRDASLSITHKDSPPTTSDSNDNDNDIAIAEIRIQDVKTAVYDFIPSSHFSSASEEAGRLDLTWKTIVLRNIDLGQGGQTAVRHLSTIITEALLTASARKVGSLPLSLVKQGLSLGGATLEIMSKETHPDKLEDSIHSVGRGASEWLHRLIPPHKKEAQPPAQNQDRH